MLILIQNVIVPVLTTILPAIIIALFKIVFTNETVLEYAISTRREKEEKGIINNLVAIVILFGLMITVRFSILFNVFAVSEGTAKIIAMSCIGIWLICVFVSMVVLFIKLKIKKVTKVKKHQETNHKKPSRCQMFFVYIFIFSSMGISFIFYHAEFKIVDIAIFMYIASVTNLCLRGFKYFSNGIDRAIVFFEERVYSEISGKEELKRVYIYHKVENDYLLCGEEIEMDKPTRVIEVKEFLKNGFHYVR